MDSVNIIKETVNSLLDLLLIKGSVEVKEDNEAYSVNIQADESTGLLIGKKGQTLLSLQTIVSLVVKNKIGEWKKIFINVGDWREKQEDYLKNLATQIAERVKTTGEDQPIYHLNAGQRRIVHMFLSQDAEVTTESQGEGEERYLVVKKK